MRRFASTWIGRILFGILMLGLAGYGISSFIPGLAGSNTVAKAGDTEITTAQFQRAYQQRLNQFAQQTGQQPTPEQALQLGIPSAVIGQLASDASLDQFARRLNVGVSDAKLAEMVRDDPSFANALGTFDKTNFTAILQQNGYTETEYFNLQRAAARRRQVATGLLAGVEAPKFAADLLHRYRDDKRTVEYFTVNSTNVPSPPDPTDADLEAYLKAHQADYRTKETRTVDVLALSPETLAAQYQPTDDQVRAEYEKTKAQLTTVEKRDIQQVALPDDAKAQFMQQQHDQGVPFLDAVKAAGLTPTDFGLLAKADVQDANLANAAYGLAKEGDFIIIPGIGGKRAVGVTKIQAGGTTPYEQAKGEIATRLAVASAKTAYSDIQDQIEELRAAFKPLKEIAARFKLTPTTVAVTADGAQLSTVPGLAEADRSKVASAVFSAEQGKLAPTVSLASTNNVWFDLTKVDVARDQTLAEVRDAVAAAWTTEKTNEAIKAEVDKISAELNSGKSFADVASDRGQIATPSLPLSRTGDKSTIFTQQVAAAIFQGGPDSHGSAVDGDGDTVVFHVTDIEAATGDPDKNITTYLENNTRDILYASFVNAVRDSSGLSINQQVLGQVLNLNTSP